MNQKLPDAQAGFRKGRGPRDQIANIKWITEKGIEFKKNILGYCHKKELNCAIGRDMRGSSDCHTERSKAERERQISYIKAYIWNQERWH